jgi:opacity protein-like surface antigen
MGVVSGPPAPCTASLPGNGTFNFQDTFTTGFAAASGSGSVRTFALMANAWFDFPVEGFTPYIGGGVGYASNEVEHGLVMNGNTGGFAWQVGGGVNFPIGEKTHLGVGYRYMDAGDVELPVATLNGPINTTHEVKHHSVLVNLTFDLGN